MRIIINVLGLREKCHGRMCGESHDHMCERVMEKEGNGRPKTFESRRAMRISNV